MQRRECAVNSVFSILKADKGTLKNELDVYAATLFGFKVSGELTTEHNGIISTVGKGTFFVLRLDRQRQIKDSGSTVYFIAEGKAVDNFMQLYPIGDGFSVYAPDCFTHFLKLLEADKNASEAIYLMHSILNEADKAYRTGLKVKKDTAAMIKEYIDARITAKLTFEELTRVFFLSRTQIFRLFKERYGVSPMQYHTEKKLEKAKELLEGSELRVSDIAEALSFSDAKYMSKLFKKYTGMLPKNYRREARYNKIIQ